MQKFLTAVGILLITAYAPAQEGMSVEEAYRAIPHQRTVFDPGAAEMPDPEREYLRRAFHLIDRAIVERVEMLRWLDAGKNGRRPVGDYDAILGELEALAVPSKLAAAHRLILEAIKEQRQVLEAAAGEKALPAGGVLSYPGVKQASAKLIEAYNLLIAAYPQEGGHNKQAFFDYLCALDFL